MHINIYNNNSNNNNNNNIVYSLVKRTGKIYAHKYISRKE